MLAYIPYMDPMGYGTRTVSFEGCFTMFFQKKMLQEWLNFPWTGVPKKAAGDAAVSE